MTRTIELLRYMVNKERVTVLGLAAALNWTEKQVRNASQLVLKSNYIEVVWWEGVGRVAFYRITASGVERSKHAPKTRLQLLQEQRARRAQKSHVLQRQADSKAERKARAAEALAEERRQRAVLAAIEREEERARIAGLAEVTVQGAKVKRHALDLAWGAMA